MIYREIVGDLFKCRSEYVLAHCISHDAEMGKGIAEEFATRNPSMRAYIRSHTQRQIGDVIAYQGKEHLVMNMITKKKYNGKPTRASLNNAIVALKNEMVARGFVKLALPLIGSGLDRLVWADTREVIKDVFKETNIQIFVIVRTEHQLHSI